ncbi:MAG: hypothetical protein ACI4LX_09855 [Treponema sp.]
MKKLLVFIALLNVSFGIFALEFKPFYTGFKLEANQNSNNRVAAGIGIESVYSFSDYVLLGTTILCSSDFTRFTTLEILLNPAYLFQFSFMKDRARLSVGAAVGYEQIHYDKTLMHVVSIGAEVRMFIRLGDLKKSKLCLVPVIRAGYPYIWSAGLSLGAKF